MAMVSSKPQKLVFHTKKKTFKKMVVPYQKKITGCIPFSSQLLLFKLHPVPTSNSATSSDGGLSSADAAVGRRAMDGGGYQVRDTYQALFLSRDDTIRDRR